MSVLHQKRNAVKHCPKCDTTKDINCFGRDASRTDGRYTYCKTCRLKPKSRAEQEAEELASKQMKRCTKCDKIKPFHAFDHDSSKRFGVASSCKKCHRERKMVKAAEWHSSKQELENLFLEGKSKCTKCGSIKRLREFLKSNRSKHGVYRLCKMCNNSYRARRRPSQRDYTNWEIFERDHFTCYICEEILDPATRHPDPMSLSIDHVVPISKGGADTADNVRTACLRCNLDKRDMMLEVYLALRAS